jgi:hypothetical protein
MVSIEKKVEVEVQVRRECYKGGRREGKKFRGSAAFIKGYNHLDRGTPSPRGVHPFFTLCSLTHYKVKRSDLMTKWGISLWNYVAILVYILSSFS